CQYRRGLAGARPRLRTAAASEIPPSWISTIANDRSVLRDAHGHRRAMEEPAAQPRVRPVELGNDIGGSPTHGLARFGAQAQPDYDLRVGVDPVHDAYPAGRPPGAARGSARGRPS